MPPKTDPKPIGLAELIFQVKRELLSPAICEADPAPLFAVDEIELELAVSVTREAETGINIQVLSIGGGLAHEDVQTVRVTLRPLRTREELLADLKARDPQRFAEMIEASQHLLKGIKSPEDPPTWP